MYAYLPTFEERVVNVAVNDVQLYGPQVLRVLRHLVHARAAEVVLQPVESAVQILAEVETVR